MLTCAKFLEGNLATADMQFGCGCWYDHSRFTMLALVLNSNSKRETLPLTETFRIQVLLLPAATKLGQGNIFTGLCLSTGGGAVCLSASWDIPPWEQTPLGPDPTPGTRPHLRDQTPQEQTPPGAHRPRTRPPRTRNGRPPRTRPAPPREADSSIRSTSGRYASYWNAFLWFLWRVSSVPVWFDISWISNQFEENCHYKWMLW